MGNGIAIVVISNITNKSCVVSGFPVVTLDLDGAAPVRAVSAPNGGYILSEKPPVDVMLAPGGVAFFGVASEHNCQPTSVAPTQKNFATVSLLTKGIRVYTRLSK